MANEKISEYINTRNTLADGDLFDVSAFLNPGFESQKVTYAIFKANLASAGFLSSGDNISLLNNDAGFVTSNITHIGEVTGLGTLTIDSTAITNKTTVTGVSGDFVLISDTSDGGNLKKVDVVDFLGGGADGNGIYDGSGTLQAGATTVGMSTTDTLTFGTDALHIDYNNNVQRVAVNGTSFIGDEVFRVNGGMHFGLPSSKEAIFDLSSGTGLVFNNTSGGNNATFTFNTNAVNKHHNFFFEENSVLKGGYQYDLSNNATRGDGFKFYAKSFSTNDETLWLDQATDNVVVPNGNLGVGVNLPLAKLHVAGDAQIEGTINVNQGAGISSISGTGNDTMLELLNATTTAISRVRINNNLHLCDYGTSQAVVDTDYQGKSAVQGLGTDLVLGVATNATSSIRFVTDNGSLTNYTERATMNFSGEWGINTTPTSGYYLHVGGNGIFGTGTPSGERLTVFGNIRVDATTSATSSGSSGTFMEINVGGTTYKIDLHNV